jgi:hypothetical protein
LTIEEIVTPIAEDVAGSTELILECDNTEIVECVLHEHTVKHEEVMEVDPNMEVVSAVDVPKVLSRRCVGHEVASISSELPEGRDPCESSKVT